MTATFHIDATLRLADGSTLNHTEAHEVGATDPETGGVIVSYSHEFACSRAEELAAEMGGEVIDVDSFTYDHSATAGYFEDY